MSAVFFLILRSDVLLCANSLKCVMLVLFTAFGALTLLDGRQEEHPACKETGLEFSRLESWSRDAIFTVLVLNKEVSSPSLAKN